MKRLHIKIIKWVCNKFGYKIAMVKHKDGTVDIEGDVDLLRYVDVPRYFLKKEPCRTWHT